MDTDSNTRQLFLEDPEDELKILKSFSEWVKTETPVLIAYGFHKWVNFRDYDDFDGIIAEPTFRDSLFDVWKMDYSYESSKLIELAKKITYDRFIELLTPQKIVGDIAFQVSAQLAAYVAGKVVGIGIVSAFSSAGSSVPGLGTAIGFVVGMLTYWLINSLNQIEQTKKRNNYIAYQTTYNENYDSDSDKTLSKRWWKDEYFSETMTHTLQGTKGGVYSEVKAETDKYIYTGQVILAPPGVEKTTNFGTTIKNIVLDYSQQTRSYLAYSDWGERLNPFFYQVVEYDLGHLTISAANPQDHRIKFMRNSIMYLEDQIYAETSSNEDKSYDRIIPYMMSIKPSLQFVDSDSMVAPEFYLNYPIYVDHEEYIADHGDGKLLKDEYYHIYKVYDTYHEGTIQLIPEEYIANRPLMSDIVKIEAWLVDTLGREVPLGDVVSRHEFNNITGEVTFTFDEVLDFNSEINGAKEDNKGINGYDAYIVLEFYIEKYRDITVERDDISPEVAQRIATMQSAHQSILEYTYQYTIAERTQERLSEICYTTFITITSTLIVMGATWGLNKAFAGIEANVYANAASKSLAKFGEASKAYGAISSMAQQALRTSGRSLAFNMFKVTCAVITETLEELYVDPMIEAYVTNKIKDMGGSEITQILWSGLAESGREQFLSSVTSFMRAGFGGRTQVDTNIQQSATNIENAIESNLENRLATEEARAQQQLRQEYLKEGISTILMFVGAMAGGFGGSIGTALGNIMMVAGTSVEGIDSIKDMFEAVLKKEPIQAQHYPLDARMEDSFHAYVELNNYITEDLSDAIKWAQLSQPQKQKQERYIPSVMEEYWSTPVSFLGSRLCGPHLRFQERNHKNHEPTIIKNDGNEATERKEVQERYTDAAFIKALFDVIRSKLLDLEKEESYVDYFKFELSNEFGLTYDSDIRFKRADIDLSLPSSTSLSKMFGVDPVTVRRWMSELEVPGFTIGDNIKRLETIRKIHSATLRVFNSKKTRSINYYLQQAIFKYTLQYYRDADLATRFLFTMDKYVKKPLSATKLSTSMDQSRGYLGKIKATELGFLEKRYSGDRTYQTLSKYFKFLTNVLLIKPRDNIGRTFKDPSKINDFKDEISKLVFSRMSSKKFELIRDSEAGKAQFEAISEILYALSKARLSLPYSQRKQFMTQDNLRGLYTLVELAIELSPADDRTLFAAQFRNKRPTLQLDHAILLLRENMAYARAECQQAISKVRKYVSDEIKNAIISKDAKTTGDLAHDILEWISLISLREQDGFTVEWENKLVQQLGLRYRIDLLINKDSKFSDKINKFLADELGFDKDQINKIEQISIDFTMDKSTTQVRDKGKKFYQSEKRVFLIVHYGPNKDHMVDSVHRSIFLDPKIPHKQNIGVITDIEYRDNFLELSKNHFEIFENFGDILKNVFDRQYSKVDFQKLIDLWESSRKYFGYNTERFLGAKS